MDAIQFANKLLQKRKEFNITQERLAEFLGVSKSAVSKWEKSQSFPDITLLPKLATYFNISIDELLSYEPQMPREQIRTVYKQLSEKFSLLPFTEVEKEIEELVTKYYSCYPLLLQVCQLYLNYYKLADNPSSILHKVKAYCERIMTHSDDSKLVYEAQLICAMIQLIEGNYEEVLHILGEDAHMQYGSEQLISTALSMRGDKEKAKEVLQVSTYLHMLELINNSTNMLPFEIDQPAHFDQTVERIEMMITQFSIPQLNFNAALLFYLQAATGYIQQQREDRAQEMIEKYIEIVLQITFPIELRGDDYFYLLDQWIGNNIHLGAQAPRDEKSIKKDLLSTLTDNSLFAPIIKSEKIQLELQRVKRYLRIEEEDL